MNNLESVLNTINAMDNVSIVKLNIDRDLIVSTPNGRYGAIYYCGEWFISKELIEESKDD